MAERMYFFDSTEDNKRIYNADDFARFHSQIIGNGVSNTESLPDLEVTAGANMEVNLGAGYMFANGFMYENDSTKTLEHDVADNDNDRIDRVVIRFDRNPDLKEREGNKAIILKGAPDSNPKPPEVVREGYIYDMSVAQVRIIAGKSFIEDEEITDERSLEDLSGYIPLHNIYRGMQINEYGMVTMPNQSYADILTENPGFSLKYRDEQPVPMDEIITDHQNEVKNNKFIPKADGVYYIWAHISSHEADIRDADDKPYDVQIILRRNGKKDDWPIFARVLNGRYDNIWIGNTITKVKAGDEIEVLAFLQHPNDGEEIPLRSAWLRFGKMS